MVKKPCFYCGKPATRRYPKVFFQWRRVFREWVDRNKIISADRSRFDGMRERLRWAALDETDEGAHAQCALEWAVLHEGYSRRYPANTRIPQRMG